MTTRSSLFHACRALAAASVVSLAADASAEMKADIRVDVDKPVAELSPHLYGLFFEDINFGADGGLYAELVQNRSFEYYAINRDDAPAIAKSYNPLFAWQKVERDNAKVSLAVSDAKPLNANNTHYLELKIDKPGVAGVSNEGFDGIPIDSGAKYDVSLFARTADWSGDAAVTVSLELPDGSTAGSVTLDGITGDWKKLEGVITATKTAGDAQLVVTTPGKGTLALDMVSLFPQDTFKGRKNGLRKDLAQALADLHPAFLRFPGGCVAHGAGIANAYRWKESVGPVEERKPNWNLWGYHQTHGLGYFEFFQFCEDVGMTPLPVVPVGVSCGFRGLQCIPMKDMGAAVQDALDLVEFANGPADSKWGSVRAKMGHPEPFHLEYICLGNEEHDTPEFHERYPLFVKALKEKHPEIKIIGTSGLGNTPPLYGMMADLGVYSSDEHYYELPDWFIRNQHRFDSFDRDKPKIFLGEYAAWTNTIYSGLAEAAYLTGVERNGDLVDMTCYAPLLARVGHMQWMPDLIYFDGKRVLRTTNYYVQQLFAMNKGDAYLKTSVKTEGAPTERTVNGVLGIGSDGTAIEVKDVAVDGRPADLADWKQSSGQFVDKDGAFARANARGYAMLLSPRAVTGDKITYTARVRKTGEGDGVAILFGATHDPALILNGANPDSQGGYLWTIGAERNSKNLLQQVAAYDSWSKMPVAETPGGLAAGDWHDVEVELSPGRIVCSLDGKPVFDYAIPPTPLSVASSLDRKTGEVILKFVNPTVDPVDATITLAGVKSVAPKAKVLTISGASDAKNTFENPDVVKPVESEIAVAPEFTHTIPAMGLQFVRVKMD